MRNSRKLAANVLIMRRQTRDESIFIWSHTDFVCAACRWLFSAEVGAREFQRRSRAIRRGRAFGDVRGGRFDGTQRSGDEEPGDGGRGEFGGGGETLFESLRGVPRLAGKSGKPVWAFV